MNKGPVFVVGASRSGTAMLRSILNNSPDLHVAGETHYFDDLRTRLGPQATSPLSADNRDLCERYFLALGHRPYGHGGDHRRSRLDGARLRARAHELGDTGDGWFQAFCEQHASLEGSEGGERWGEKTPRHVFRLAELLAAFVDARVVVMVRDPRAVVASYGHWSNRGGLELEDGYEEALAAERDRSVASYDPTVAALLWRAGVRAALAAQREFGADRVRVQPYEALVLHPREQLAELGGFLDLAVDPGMLDIPVHNSSFTAFDGAGGVSSTPLERWRSVLTNDDVATVQLWCRREMDELGHVLEPVALSAPARVRVAARAVAAAGRAVAANRDRAGSLPGYVMRRLRLAFGP